MPSARLNGDLSSVGLPFDMVMLNCLGFLSYNEQNRRTI